MTDATLRITQDDYNLCFRNQSFGGDLAEIIASRHGLVRPLIRKVEGSNLIYHTGDGDWLKISPPFFGDAFEAELTVTTLVQDRLPLLIPEIKLSGTIEDWRYLVSANVPGVAFRELSDSLSDDDRNRIADELGAFMSAFHDVRHANFERSFGPWQRYLRGCLKDVKALHRRRGNSEEQVVEIVRFLEPRRAWLESLGPPVLTHADLTNEHVLLKELNGSWHLSGVLDLADSMLAPAALDLIAPLLGLFRGHAKIQRRLIAATGVTLPDGDWSGALMAIALQHRFMHFHDWFRSEIASGLRSVAEIAEVVFPPIR
jgi:hypothetical protein